MRNRDNNKSNRVVRVAYVSGADLMIRRELFEKYKFDPHFFMYNEEVDLCLQVHRAGYKILSNPESKITHLVGSSSKTASKSLINEKKLKMQRESLNYYMHKNHTESYRFFFYLLGKISAGLRTIEFALVGKNEYRRMWSYVYHKSKISDYK